VGVLAHPARPASFPVADQIVDLLRRHDLESWVYHEWSLEQVQAVIPGTDLVIAIGGDGAMLRAAHVCAPADVPLLGVNMGYLGFLTEVKTVDELEDTLIRLLAGEGWIETRMMLDVQAFRGDRPIASTLALNDAVISRGSEPRMIHLDMHIDGGWTTSYGADALIISTPTGSTAYALACGGPILPPELRSILIVPVAPHLSLDRPMVLPEGAVVEVFIVADLQHEIALSAGGVRVCELQGDDRVVVRASRTVSRFLRLREQTYFYRSLLDRLEPRISAPRRTNDAQP
ncbi:MAG: NAD(+)/NADH kinase, partial [Anaerolinea sp.]|nr:NAD(+)/NADH kinase [Anaerolinea sp.]